MRWICIPCCSRAPRRSQSWPARVLLALLALPYLLEPPRPTLAATPSREALIPVLFGEPDPGGLDANGDGVLTVADIILLGPDSIPTPTSTPTSTPSPTVTATATVSPTPTGLIFTGGIMDLLPHGQGDQLVYRVIDPTGKLVGTETSQVLSSDTSGAFVVDDQEIDTHQKVVKHEVQSYTDTGTQLLFYSYSDMLNNVRTVCDPPLLRLTTPLIAGQTFSTSVRCSVYLVSSGIWIGYTDRTDTFTPVERLDSYTVAAGTFSNVVHISGATNQGGTPESDEIYLAPGVGPILQLQTFTDQTTTYELTDGTVGGVPVGR
jgi:hypothetical protein